MSSFPRRLAVLPGLLMLVAASAYAQCEPRFVDAATGTDGSNDCRTSSSPCLTIQHAVDADAGAMCSGDTVNVAAGTYTEQVTIDTELKLVGADAATTTIQAPPPPLPLTPNLDIVTIGATANVELEGAR